MNILSTQWINQAWSKPLDDSYDSSNTLVLLFGSSDFYGQRKPFDDLREKFPNSQFMGCSTSGEIFNSEVEDHTLSVALVKFDKTCIRKISQTIVNPESSHKIGGELAKELSNDGLKGIFILSEGLNINGTQLIQGVNEIVSGETVISGGLAGDGTAFKKTWVLRDKYPEYNTVSMLGIYGDEIEIRTGSVGGWDVFGPERIITKSSGNILYELDDKTALELYKEYLGPKAEELPGSALLFPLTLNSKFMDRDGVVRTVLSVEEENGSMTFAGDMPEGSKAQLMHANFDRLVDGASSAASLANFTDLKKDESILSVAISCVGRRLVLGERIEDETEAVLDILPANTSQVGFYSYGEISSGKLGTCDLHNQTMTLTTIREN